MFRLTHSAIDDPEEIHEFATREEAIKAAFEWFLEGYDGEAEPEWVDIHIEAQEMRRELEEGASHWACNRCCETVDLVEI